MQKDGQGLWKSMKQTRRPLTEVEIFANIQYLILFGDI